MDLGNVSEKHAVCATYLRNAVAAYRAALEVLPPCGSTLLKWTSTQNILSEEGATIAHRAMTLSNLGIALSTLGLREEALGASREAVDIYKQLLANGLDAFRPALAASQNNLGVVLSGLGLREEALSASREAAEIYKQLVASGQDAFRPALAKSFGAYAQTLATGGRHAEAAEMMAEGLAALRPFVEKYPQALEDLAYMLRYDYAAPEQVSTNGQAVASAAEELSGSVREVTEVQQSSSTARKALEEAELTNEQVRELAEIAKRIDGISDLIYNVSAQTNLLALNATIEAARAGDAGRGFAIGALKVKQSAEQAAKATAKISEQMRGIPNSRQQAIDWIEGLTPIIEEVNMIVTNIASLGGQNVAMPQEIARNATQTSRAMTEVARNISEVQNSAESSKEASSQLLAASRDLAHQAEVLRGDVNNFLDEEYAA